MEDVIIGIDLGTTNSAVGAVESGFPILLANAQQNRITPSAVWYGAKGEVEVGEAALRRRHSGSGTVITSAKRLIGQKLSNIHSYPLALTEKIGEIFIQTAQGQISATEVSTAILTHLKSIAEQQLNTTVNKAVITVPAYFNDAQRTATKLAGERAGLTVERILSEPTAAALAFGLDKLKQQARVIVYDLGGGTFDVTLLEMNNGVFQVEATSGDTQLGGDDIDLALAKYAWSQHSNSDFHKLDDTRLARLLDEAKRVKEALTSKSSASFTIPFITSTENLQVEVTLEEFEKLISPLVERTLKHCRQVLLDGNISTPQEELSNIILVGGSTRIPAVQRAAQDFFNKEIDLSQHPDEAIALGAVIQGGIISGALRNMVLLDVTPLSLGIETYGGLMNVIIPRNSTIPCKAGEMFTNAVDQQKEMSIRVLQGEREMAKDNWPLGKINVPFTPERKGQARVGVQFSIDENGILEVLTRDTKTQKDTILKIDSAAVDVDDQKVEKMICESIDYAFDDMSERIFTEAKLKADELLPAVSVALQQVGNSLSTEDKEAIESNKEEVEKQIAAADANALKMAVQQLDKATEELATLLVEKAMEQALTRKLDD